MGETGEGSPRESELKKRKLETQHEEFIVDVGEDVTEKATKSSDDVEEVEGSMEAVGGEDPKVEEEEEEADDEDEDDDEEEDVDDDDDNIVTVIKNYEGEDKCVYGSIDSDVDKEEEDDDAKGQGGEEEEEEEEDDDDDAEVALYWKQLEESDGFYVDHVPKRSVKFFFRFVKLTLHVDISLDKKLEKLASIAVEVYNNQKAANLKFEKLLFATGRPCGTGQIFYITFSANNSANDKAATYQSIVYCGFHSGRRRNVEVQLFRRKPKW